MTYHCDVHSDFHGVHIGLDDLAKKSNLDVATEATKFLKKCPIQTLDIPEFPIPTPVNLNILKLYPRIFVDVICETYSSGTSFFPTEKTFRPIAARMPLILMSVPGALKDLQNLGFQTFRNYIDESYDTIDNEQDRALARRDCGGQAAQAGGPPPGGPPPPPARRPPGGGPKRGRSGGRAPPGGGRGRPPSPYAPGACPTAARGARGRSGSRARCARARAVAYRARDRCRVRGRSSGRTARGCGRCRCRDRAANETAGRRALR